MKIISLLTITVLSSIGQCNAFTVPGSHGLSRAQQIQNGNAARTNTMTVLFAASDERRNAADNRKARTCVRNFLTQRSIQSFMWLLKTMRDPYTNVWLEDFLGNTNLLQFHGSAALDLRRFHEWDSVFKELIQKPEDLVIVEIQKTRPGKGLSKNNPFRESEGESNYEIEIDINPASLAHRILSVRSKISKEWVTDLELVIAANDKILPSYVKRNKEARKMKDDKEPINKSNDDSDGDASFESRREGVGLPKDFNFGQRTKHTFDREAVYFLNNHPSFNDNDASPLRASSFDLLFLLSMQEAIHRILASYRDAGEEKEVSFEWLKGFYTEGLPKYFDGNQSFGRADDFIDDLLNTPPALKTFGDKMGFIDPLAIAEDIISVRKDVAEEWKEVMEDVELDHTEIRADVFRMQMEKWGQNVAPKPQETVIEEVKKTLKEERKSKLKKKDQKEKVTAIVKEEVKEEKRLEVNVRRSIRSKKRRKKRRAKTKPEIIQGGDFE